MGPCGKGADVFQQGSPKSAIVIYLEETQMDVTSLLQALVASSERSIHMCVKFACTKGQALEDSVFTVPLSVPPSLTLYLSDTSVQAYY